MNALMAERKERMVGESKVKRPVFDGRSKGCVK
jgi:hypothetical protein